jgi:alpha-beta hydrolase superfamily lysophospholipase
MRHAEGTCPGRRGAGIFFQTWSPEDDERPGASVVFVHGIGDHGGRHLHFVEALVSAGHTVIAPDMRGHGRSPGPRGHIDSWDEFREDLDAVVERAGAARPGARVFAVGHSLGGLIVLEYALRRPERLRGVVAMSPALSLDGIPRWQVAVSRVLDRIVPRLSMKVGLDSEGISRDPAIKEADAADPLVHSLASVRLGVEVQKALAWTLAHARDLHVPLLIVHGTADTVVPPGASLAFYERTTLADRTRIEYPGGYHELDNDYARDQALADINAWIAARM